MAYYDRLRQVREDKDLSQQDIAKILGTTRQQVSRYETGAQEMTVTRLATLCRTLGVSADYLLGLPKGLTWPR